MYDPNDELMQRLAGRNRQGLFDRVKENVLNPSGDNVYKAAMILAGQKPQDDSNEKLATQIALLNYKQGLKPEETPDGYASESEIPSTVGGLPLKSVSSEKGRYKPTYGKPTPLFGDNVGDILSQFDQPQQGQPQPGGQPQAPTYPVQQNPDLDVLLAEAGYADMSDEEQEDFIKFLESKAGGQNANRQQ